MVDTLGLLVGVMVDSAGIQDRDAARKLVQKIRFECKRMKIVWADGGYAGELQKWVKSFAGWTLDIIRRSDTAKGFEKLPHRWIVERTFAWLFRYRRLSKDYEFHPGTAENFIYLAMINLMLHRLAPEPNSHNYKPRAKPAAA